MTKKGSQAGKEPVKIDLVTQDFHPHSQWMFDMVVTSNAKRVLEIGTDVGDSSRIFLAALKRTGGSLTTVDIRDCKKPWADGVENVTFIQHDSRTFEWAEPIDVLFLDDHFTGMDIYSHIYMELIKFGQWVRKGGKILIHDSNHEEFGPPILRATRDYCQAKHLTYTEQPYQYGLVTIIIDKELK